ncbi:hypothetical protein N865_21645, partial [Intrasporangium oryzae NRRL B-24470]
GDAETLRAVAARLARAAAAARDTATVRGDAVRLLPEVWSGVAARTAVAEATELGRRSRRVLDGIPPASAELTRYAAALDRATTAVRALQREWDAAADEHAWASATIRLRAGTAPEAALLLARLDEEHARTQARLLRRDEAVRAELRAAGRRAARSVDALSDTVAPGGVTPSHDAVRRAVTGGLSFAEGASRVAAAQALAVADAAALRRLTDPRTYAADPGLGDLLARVRGRVEDPLYAQALVAELWVDGLGQILSAVGVHQSRSEAGQSVAGVIGSLLISATARPPAGLDPRTAAQVASRAALLGDELVDFAGAEVTSAGGRFRHAGYWLLGQALTGARRGGDSRALPQPLLTRLVTATIDAEVAETRDDDVERRHGTTLAPRGSDRFASLFEDANTTGDALHTLLTEVGGDTASRLQVLSAATGQDVIRSADGERLDVAEYLVRRWIAYAAESSASTPDLRLATNDDLLDLLRSSTGDGSEAAATVRSRVMTEIAQTSASARSEPSTARQFETNEGALEPLVVEWLHEMRASVLATIAAPSCGAPVGRAMEGPEGFEPVLTAGELAAIVGALAVGTDISSGSQAPAGAHQELVEGEVAAARERAARGEAVDDALIRVAFYERAGSAALLGEAARQDGLNQRLLRDAAEGKNALVAVRTGPGGLLDALRAILTTGTTRGAGDDLVISLLRSDVSAEQAAANEEREARISAELARLLTGPRGPASASALWAIASRAAPVMPTSDELRAARRAEVRDAAETAFTRRVTEGLSSLLDRLPTRGRDGLEIAEGRDGPLREFEALPRGKNKWVRVVPTEDAILELHATITKDAVVDPDRCYDTSFWMIRPDGIRVSLRIESDSGGATIELEFPDGTRRKVHVGEPRKSRRRAG